MSGRLSMRDSLAVLAVSCLLANPIYAFDAWRIDEIFSSADGTVQYIKLSTSTENQQNLSGRVIRTLDANGNPGETYTFATNLTGQTANRSVLLGTTAFVAASGLAVDYPLPTGFIRTEGGIVELIGAHSFSYQREQLPRNGAQALRADGSVAAANPRNFASQTATLSVAVIATFHADTAVVNLPVVDVPGMGAVNVSLQLTRENPFEFTLSEAYVYGAGIFAGDGAARFQNNGLLYIPGVNVGSERYELNMSLISESPVRFGDLSVVSVIDIPTAPVDPGPPANPLAESIAAGQMSYAQFCASCHGSTGGGTVLGPSLLHSVTMPFETLRLYNNNSMPFGNPASCADNANSKCATDVTNFIRNGFNRD